MSAVDTLLAQISSLPPDPSGVPAAARVNADGSVSIPTGTQPAPVPPTPTPDPSRPANLPAKFKNVDELIKSYGELEKKMGSGNKPADPPAPAPAPAPAAAPTEAEAAAAAQKAGLDLAKLEEEYRENNNSLKPETMAKLQTAGIDKNYVDTYVKGVEALRAQKLAGITEAAGGKEAMDAALKWAASNLTKGEIDAVNETFRKGDVATATLAMQGVVARMQRELGHAPGLITSGQQVPSGQGGVQPFGSNHELVAAMKDPRYKAGDPAYHKMVMDRLAVSNFGGGKPPR